ncbi:MAG: ABC transporter ATP-binding protein [Candidatus Zixiibacteriota bacterium]|nr:MAG: ABC transporter ATP-binding protein [candidate division Zixibacteria bacterium]
MSDQTTAIQITGISKNFRGTLRGNEVRALVDVSLAVNHGEIFGLLGPNGAGKTTLVKILLGALRPSAGTATINGHDITTAAARGRVGFLPENHRFPPYQTGLQMLYCFGGMTGMSRSEIRVKADGLLELVGMSQWRGTRVKKYSKGMMQRLGLAQVMLNDPEIVFLDEPTDGVDPIGRHEIRNILLDLKKMGKTIFLNSHLLAEVESICDRVAILDRGKLIKTGPVAGLIDVRPAYRIETTGLNVETAQKIQDVYPGAIIDDNRIRVTFDDPLQVNGLTDLIRECGVSLISVTPEKISLEESFMQLIRESKQHE